MYAEVLTGLDVNSPSWDLFIYLFFILAIFLYGFTLGRTRIMLLIVATYMALAAVRTAPFIFPQDVTVGSSPFFIVQITAFVGTMLVIFFLLSSTALKRALYAEDVQGGFWQVVLFSIAHVGLLVSSVLSFLPPDRQAALLLSTREVFTTQWSLFIWTVLPIALMMFVKPKEE